MTDEASSDPFAFMRDHIRRYRSTNGADGYELEGGLHVLLLNTKGAKSGEIRTVPLVFGRAGESYTVVASKLGSPVHPKWYGNLLAHPDVTIEVKDRIIPVRARTAGPDERERLWAEMVKVFPGYADYQAKTTRVLPIVVLDPVKA